MAYLLSDCFVNLSDLSIKFSIPAFVFKKLVTVQYLYSHGSKSIKKDCHKQIANSNLLR